MGIKQTDIEGFLEPGSQGFLYDTARSFLKRHSNPESLLGQLKSLLAQGELDSCCDLIQLIIREGHILADDSAIYLLRAQIAFEKAENREEIVAWLQQAKCSKKLRPENVYWDELMQAKTALNEGDYHNGQLALEELAKNETVGHLAKYQLAHHLFWRNLDPDRALNLLLEVTAERFKFIKAWSCLGFAYNRSGQKAKAQEAFGYCIELDSNPDRLKIYRQHLAS